MKCFRAPSVGPLLLWPLSLLGTAAVAAMMFAATPAAADPGTGALEVSVTVPGVEPPAGLRWLANYRCDNGPTGETSFDATSTAAVAGIPAGESCEVRVRAVDSAHYDVAPARSARVSAGSTTPMVITASRRLTTIMLTTDVAGTVGATRVGLDCAGPGDEHYRVADVALTGAGIGPRIKVDGIPTGMLCTMDTSGLPAGVTTTPAVPKVLAGRATSLQIRATGRIEVALDRSGGSGGHAIALNYTCAEGTAGSKALRGGERLALTLSAGTRCRFTVADDAYTTRGEVSATAPQADAEMVTIPVTRATTTVSVSSSLSGGEPDLYASVSCTGPDSETFDVVDVPLQKSADQEVGARITVPTGLNCQVTPSADGPGFVFQPATRSVTGAGSADFAAKGTGSLGLSIAVSGASDRATFPVAYSCTDGTHGLVDLGPDKDTIIEGIVGGASCDVTGSATHFTSANLGRLSIPAGGITEATVGFVRRQVPLTIEASVAGGSPLLAADVSCVDPGTSEQAKAAPPFAVSGLQVLVSAAGVGSAQVEGIPDGYQCTVKARSLTDGFVIADPDVVALAGETATIAAAGRGTFAISLARYGGAENATIPVAYSCTDGTAGTTPVSSVKIATVPNVLGGSTCTAKASSEIYELTLPGSPTRIGAGLVSATTITAIRRTTTLTLTSSAAGGGGTLVYSVNCTGPGETFTLPAVSLVAGEYSGPDTRVIPGVPTDLTCVVKPAKLPPGFTADAPERTVKAGGKVTFATLGTGSVTLQTTVTGAPATAMFDILYSCTDGTKHAYRVGVAGDTRRVDRLRGGISCDVTATAPGFRAKIAKSPWTVVPGEVNPVVIALTRERADLIIEATTNGPEGVFHYDVACADEDEKVVTTAVLATVDGEGITIVPQVPSGLSCDITEKSQAKWVVAQPRQSTLPGRTVTFVHQEKKPITVAAFYDTNLNGKRDAGEVPLPGWQVSFDGATATTGTKGEVTANVVSDASRSAGKAPGWHRTSADPAGSQLPARWDLALVCLGAGSSSSLAGLHDPSWWAGSGLESVTSADLAALRQAPLVDAQGKPFDPNEQGELGPWLASAPAESTAARLSQQLAAGMLNLRHTSSLAKIMVVAPESGFVTMEQLLAMATASLQADNYTPPADPNRVTQDRVDKAMTSANSGQSSVHPTPCAVPTEFSF